MDKSGERLIAMKNARLRLIALLALICLLPCVGCKQEPAESAPAATIEIMLPLFTPEPSDAPIPTPERSPSEKFALLDSKYFIRLVTEDYYTFHNYVKNASALGVDASAVPLTWGAFSMDELRSEAAEDALALEELLSIDREQLTEREQLSYDVLEQYLNLSVEAAKYEYYFEPLIPMAGFHSTLPILLGIYSIKTEADANSYLALLEDVPRFLGDILAYEREKAASGLFMCEDALDSVLDQCKDIISARSNFYLVATFNEAIDNVAGLSAEQKQTYKKSNEALVTKNFIDAYVSLSEGLEALRSECRAGEGLYALGDDGLNYYAALLKNAGSCDLTPNEALSLLENELYNMTVAGSVLRMENLDAADEIKERVTTGDTDSDIKYLRELSYGLLGDLGEHSLTISEVPEELEKQSNPAMFLKPAIDDWKNNTVLINSAAINETFLMTLAHETYPGHLYQFVSQRANPELSLTQRILPLTGYEEGWSQTAEKLVIETQGLFPRDALLYRHYRDMVFYTVMPAIVSIKVNYQGEGLDEIKQYLAAYGAETLAEAYYRIAIIAPDYYLTYALGYCQFAEAYRSAENDLGAAFDQKAYLKKYLDLGAAQYNILRERMDVWVDEQVSD